MLLFTDIKNNYRSKEIADLRMILDQHRSVCLIGMKRVGISDLLRHYVKLTTNNPAKEKLLVYIDLNDLVEHSLLAFWRLFLKRLTDTIVNNPTTPESTKKIVSKQFELAIQLGDLFMTVEAVRASILATAGQKISICIMIVNFDRPIEIYDTQFVNNLAGLVDTSSSKLTFILTADRPLYELSPQAFHKTNLNNWLSDIYIMPVSTEDAKIAVTHFTSTYKHKLTEAKADKLIELCGGHIQYLQFAILASQSTDTNDLLKLLITDENIQLQSEEIFSSLTQPEQKVVSNISSGRRAEPNSYLLRTGLVTLDNQIFSPLFLHFIQNKSPREAADEHLTKKEKLLFELLHSNLGMLCDRELIVTKVWPEYALYGVTDWAIDRLISRLRKKLKRTKPHLTIKTIKTRGFKMLA